MVVCTVDSAIGREADITVYSCTRSPHRNVGRWRREKDVDLGFVSRPTAMNVATSRSRFMLVIVGDAEALTDAASSGTSEWNERIDFYRKMGFVRKALGFRNVYSEGAEFDSSPMMVTYEGQTGRDSLHARRLRQSRSS